MMNLSPNVYVKPIEITNKLADLGVTATNLREAILNGEAERATCTENDVGPMAGLKQWNGTLRRLREILATQGWRRDRSEHLESVQRDDGRIAIAVSMGDESTGDASRSPRTKNPRGDAVIRAITKNNIQLRLAFDAHPTEKEPSARIIWILLVHTTDEETLSELSLPLSVDQDGHADRWADRIILDPISHGPDPESGDVDDEEDIEIQVQRRAQ